MEERAKVERLDLWVRMESEYILCENGLCN